MKKYLLIILSALFINACISSNEQKVDKLFSEYTGNNPGASVIVIIKGKTELKKSYGLADLEKKTKVDSTTNFRLASLTKQFTAMCIMMLVEREKLKYENTLTEIFPEFPEYGKKITITQILQHTSGLIAYESLLADSVTIQVSDAQVLQMMISQDSTYHVPGSKYRYSNSGYAILAMIIEKISKKPFAQFLQENIFRPLKMNNTIAYEKGISLVPNRAYGYKIVEPDAKIDSSFIFGDQSRTSAVLGDGGIYSSVEDLFKWDQALYSEKLVSKESLQKAWTPAVVIDSPDNIYGFGWRIDQLEGHRRLHHNGSTSGFRNSIQRFPEDLLTIIVLTNRNKPSVFSLVEKIAGIYLN
ncbi:MAG: class A beta-lactamase-related serine hydrolase [Calditrichaeota bacterium]|nr:MAG: class A beta-lactamase-related serine hydrolase [Calditrichota bacterium]MBL1204091.1 class A beta-lactamase-related serine hydrolase [Calditrichota bacterium]NOG43922.1 beta-lactamase family protein [Calditrichota bacterium]